MKAIKKIIAFFLVLILVIPVSAATVSEAAPCASAYLNSYSANISSQGSSSYRVTFTARATSVMDKLGAVSITVYQSMDGANWSNMGTISGLAGMIGEDKIYYNSYLDITGDAGVYYQAKVGIIAEKDGSSETRYLFTDVIRLG